MTDFAVHMEIVATKLLGPPHKHLSKGSDLRFGTNGSLSVDIEKGTWYSHEEKKGGGVLDLIHRMTRLNAKKSITWMRSMGLDSR